MYRFEDPLFLWLLLLIPLFAVIRFVNIRRQKKKLAGFGDRALIEQMMEHVSKSRPLVKFWLLQTALALLVIMLARPQMGSKVSQEKRKGIEVVIAVDISNSMLAKDVIPSRLDRTKMLVENMIDRFTNDKVGLIVYAGDAFVQLPITGYYVSAKMFLQNIDPTLIQTQGTDIGEAIRLSINSFGPDSNIGRAIVLVTDGEDHEGGAAEAAKEARKKGIHVFILGVGTAEGAPVQLPDGSYVTDQSGETVVSKLNEEMCRQIAQAGSGTYIHVDNTGLAQEQLESEMTKLQKGDTSSVIYSEYDEQYQAVGIILLFVLLLEVCIYERKNPLFRHIRLFKSK